MIITMLLVVEEVKEFGGGDGCGGGDYVGDYDDASADDNVIMIRKPTTTITITTKMVR